MVGYSLVVWREVCRIVIAAIACDASVNTACHIILGKHLIFCSNPGPVRFERAIATKVVDSPVAPVLVFAVILIDMACAGMVQHNVCHHFSATLMQTRDELLQLGSCAPRTMTMMSKLIHIGTLIAIIHGQITCEVGSLLRWSEPYEVEVCCQLWCLLGQLSPSHITIFRIRCWRIAFVRPIECLQHDVRVLAGHSCFVELGLLGVIGINDAQALAGSIEDELVITPDGRSNTTIAGITYGHSPIGAVSLCHRASVAVPVVVTVYLELIFLTWFQCQSGIQRVLCPTLFGLQLCRAAPVCCLEVTFQHPVACYFFATTSVIIGISGPSASADLSAIVPFSNGKQVFSICQGLVGRLVPHVVPVDSSRSRAHSHEEQARLGVLDIGRIDIARNKGHLDILVSTTPRMDKERGTSLVPLTATSCIKVDFLCTKRKRT